MGIQQIEYLTQQREKKSEEVKNLLKQLKNLNQISFFEWEIEEISLQLEGLIEKLNRDTINIAIVSEVSSGKSTFLNALIFGEPILESRLGETTAKIFKIKYGENFSINGKKYASLTKLKEEIHQENQVALTKIQQQQILKEQLSIITLPNKNLKKGIELYDTPGFATINQKSMLSIIKKAIAQSDATILLLDISQGIKESERLFIKTILHKINPNKRFIVLNKYDSVINEDDLLLKSAVQIEEEIQSVINSVSKTLSHLQKDQEQPITTYHLSAKKALVAKMTTDQKKLEESRFSYFEENFWQHILEAKEELFDDHTELFSLLKEESKSLLKDEKKRLLKKINETKEELLKLHIQEKRQSEILEKLSLLMELNQENSQEEKEKKPKESYMEEITELLNLNLEVELSHISWLDKLTFWQLKQQYQHLIESTIDHAQSYLERQIYAFIKQHLNPQKEEEKVELIKEINEYLKIDFSPKKYPKSEIRSITTHALYRIKQSTSWNRNMLLSLIQAPYGNQKLLYPDYWELKLAMDKLEEITGNFLVESEAEIQEYITTTKQAIDLLEKKFQQKSSLHEHIKNLTQGTKEIDAVLATV